MDGILMEISLESLGLSTEGIRQHVVDTIVDRFLTSTVSDEDGEPVMVASQFKAAIQKAIITRVDESVERLLAPVLEPTIDQFITAFRVQHTNTYGEPKRDPETITEYMIRRTNEWMIEGVDWQGRTKEDLRKSGVSNWSTQMATTRVTFAIDKRLHEDMEKAMKTALTDANKAITDGLKSAVIFELNKLNAKLKA